MMSDREYAQFLSDRLREVGMNMEPSDDRATVLLCARIITEQAAQIEELQKSNERPT